jgi:hypothetical protein
MSTDLLIKLLCTCIPFRLYVHPILCNLSSLSCTIHKVFHLLGPNIHEYARLLPLLQVDVFQGASPPELFIHSLHHPTLAKKSRPYMFLQAITVDLYKSLGSPS